MHIKNGRAVERDWR